MLSKLSDGFPLHLNTFCEKYHTAGLSPLLNSAKIHVWGGGGQSCTGLWRFNTPTLVYDTQSIFIFLIPVLGHCLHVMVVLAKRLPVTLIPKQNRITPMRFDVVNHSRFHKPSLPLTLNAKRMAFKKPFSCLPPLTVIPSHCWIPTFLPMQRSVFFTIHSVHQLWTAGMLTRFLWFSWHSTTLLSYVTGTVKG